MNKYILTTILLIVLFLPSNCFGQETWVIRGINNTYVLMQNGKIKSSMAKGGVIPIPQDSWTYNYPQGNPVTIYSDGTTLVKRAYDGSGVRVLDYLSDNSYDIPIMHEGGQYYEKIINTKRGIQKLNVFFDNGMPQYQIDYKSKQLEMYTMDGKRRRRTDVLTERHGVVSSLVTGIIANTRNTKLYNNYFKTKAFTK